MKRNKPPAGKGLKTNASVALARQALGDALGQSYGGDRNIYGSLGWKETLTYKDYDNRFRRGNIAKRIITAPVDATWRGTPIVYEDGTPEEPKTKFETSWTKFSKKWNLLNYFTRVDKLAGIGQYAILFFGFNDGGALESECTKATELLYLQPYSQDNAPINTYETDPTNERYGLPLTYKIKVQDMKTNTIDAGKSDSRDIIVHHSRVQHVAEGLLESNVLGTPRLEAVFNTLMGMDLLLGGSAEMFWRGAFPGMALEMDPEADALTSDEEDDLNDELDDYVHNLRRTLQLRGIKANMLDPSIESPKEQWEVHLQAVSGTTGIPVRILTGSERGELASTQDKSNWNDRVLERRDDYAAPTIYVPFIQKLITVGIIDPLADEDESPNIAWPDETVISDKDSAEITFKRTTALKEYVESGASILVPPLVYLVEYQGFTQEEAEQALMESAKIVDEEDDDLEDEPMNRGSNDDEEEEDV